MEDLNLWSFLRFMFVVSRHEFLVCSLVMKRLWFPYVYLKYSESWIQMSNRHYILIRFLLCHTLTWRPCIYFGTWNSKHWIGKNEISFKYSSPCFLLLSKNLLEWKLIFCFTGSEGRGPWIYAQRHIYNTYIYTHTYTHIYIVLGGMFMVVRKLKIKHFLFPHPFQQVSAQISKRIDCERSLYAVLRRKCCELFILFIYTIGGETCLSIGLFFLNHVVFFWVMIKKYK